MSAMSTERESRPMPLPALMLKNTRNLRQETLLTVPALPHDLRQDMGLPFTPLEAQVLT